MMNDFKNILLRKWIFLFIFTVIPAPVLILAETSIHFSLAIPDLKVNFYSIPSASEQHVRNLEGHREVLLKVTENNASKSRKFNASAPEDPHHCQNEQTILCDSFHPYRTVDGSCNNLIHPKWGTVNECYMRYQPAAYEGFEDFQKSTNGDPLPPVRDLIVNIFKDVHRPSQNISFMFTVFGQIVAHDMSLSENKNVLEKCCEDSPDNEACIHISIRSTDSFYSPFNVTCLELHRTLSCEICNTTKREQVNGVTAALDASMVYGTSNKRMMDVRANDGTGKMMVSPTEKGDLLPEDIGRYGTFCRQKKLLTCFMGGDIRVNQHFYLTGISTYYVREHNRIATILKSLNPHWEEEKLYQEARRINTATLQCITYKEYLPALLGPSLMEQFNLTLKKGPDGSKYNPQIRLGVSNEFSTAAFRLHSMVPKFIGGQHPRFKDYYSNPELVREGNMEEIMQRSYQIPSEEYDHYFVDDVTNYMAKRQGMPYGLDLGSLDIQRGRDHGLSPYVAMVRFCSKGRVDITTFDDLAPLLMTEEKAEMLKKNYNAVEDIDLFVGMQMENLFPGAAVGPTAACIIAMQFHSTKFGDRFFFEHKGEVPSFNAAQRDSLKQCSLSRILCDNSDATYVPKNLMLLPSNTNPEVPCEDIPNINLSLWKERTSVKNSLDS